MLVGNRMSHPVITVYPDMLLQDALDLMHKERIRRLPVVDHRGKLIGIVSERVLLKAYPSDATSLSVWEMRSIMKKVTIEEFLTRQVITVTEDTPIEEAARIMTDNRISGLPVMRDDKLVGFITETDIFKIFLEVMGARDPGVRITAEAIKKPGVLASITKAVYELGGDITALGTFSGESSESAEILIKIDCIDSSKVVEAITPFVEKIMDVRGTPSQVD
jgi:acetoin utilization protein AcuB